MHQVYALQINLLLSSLVFIKLVAQCYIHAQNFMVLSSLQNKLHILMLALKILPNLTLNYPLLILHFSWTFLNLISFTHSHPSVPGTFWFLCICSLLLDITMKIIFVYVLYPA